MEKLNRIETIELKDVLSTQENKTIKLRMRVWAGHTSDDGIVLEDRTGIRVVIENHNGYLTVYTYDAENDEPKNTIELESEGLDDCPAIPVGEGGGRWN